jgi:cell division protein FtsN
MSDKDQFTFDDKDDFPEANLSSAFSDGEFEADKPASDIQEDLEQTQGKISKSAEKSSGSGGSRTRILLIILLLVVAGGAGAYYFMDLGGTAPVVPTVMTPAKKTQKTVALPPQPAKPVSVAVPPPPAQPAAKPAAVEAAEPVAEEAAKSAAVQKEEDVKSEPEPVVKAVEKPAQQTSTKTAVQMAAPTQDPVKVARSASPAKPVAASKPAQQTAAEPRPASAGTPTPASGPVTAPAQVADGAFALDAGSYLFESNRDALVAKINKLGYESLVTPVDAKVDMTRLRLGTYRKEEVRNALDFARSIEPGAYSAPAGDGYVIYAGTFLKKGTVDKLTKRFLAEGVKVHPEPVQVVRTLSRIRFGSFATREDAMVAANAAGKVGVKAVVVKAK